MAIPCNCFSIQGDTSPYVLIECVRLTPNAIQLATGRGNPLQSLVCTMRIQIRRSIHHWPSVVTPWHHRNYSRSHIAISVFPTNLLSAVPVTRNFLIFTTRTKRRTRRSVVPSNISRPHSGIVILTTGHRPWQPLAIFILPLAVNIPRHF